MTLLLGLLLLPGTARADWRAGIDALGRDDAQGAWDATIGDARSGDAAAQWIAATAAMLRGETDDGMSMSPEDRKTACGLLRESAEQGFPYALMSFGGCVLLGKGSALTEDDVVTMLAYKLAALKQLPDDQDILDDLADTSAAEDPVLRARAQAMADKMAQGFKPASQWSDVISTVQAME